MDRNPQAGLGTAAENARNTVDAVYRSDSRHVLATLIRLLGDFDIAEEALHDAFRAALEQWPRDGVPANPRAWLVSTGRFKAIDAIRRRARLEPLPDDIDGNCVADADDPEAWNDESVRDDRLRLIFTCCHPALSPDAQVAMTLREVCGLTTEEIARAFLTSPPTVAQRIVRAKAKIRNARIPYEVPSATDLPDRLDAVLRVVYLVFNEGYSASSGAALTRHDLSSEAIRLGRLLVELLPEPEALGLLALMLLHDSRRAARTSPSGELILLNDQDRSLVEPGSDRGGLDAGGTGTGGTPGSAPTPSRRRSQPCTPTHPPPPPRTGHQIVGLYDLLARAEPSPVVELNRAVAVAMRDGPSGGAYAHRRHPWTRRSLGLPPRACGAGGPLPAAGANRGSPSRLRTGSEPDGAGAGAAVSEAAAG